MAAQGALVSLHSQTARQAFQYLSIAMPVQFLGPLLLFLFAPAAWKESLTATQARFQRARLIDRI